jgi:hypothetical protein
MQATKSAELLETGKVLAEVAECLAHEIISEYSADEYRELLEGFVALDRAVKQLVALGLPVPPVVEMVLENFRRNAPSTLNG